MSALHAQLEDLQPLSRLFVLAAWPPPMPRLTRCADALPSSGNPPPAQPGVFVLGAAQSGCRAASQPRAPRHRPSQVRLASPNDGGHLLRPSAIRAPPRHRQHGPAASPLKPQKSRQRRARSVERYVQLSLDLPPPVGELQHLRLRIGAVSCGTALNHRWARTAATRARNIGFSACTAASAPATLSAASRPSTSAKTTKFRQYTLSSRQ
jgi:hypothetical protein